MLLEIDGNVIDLVEAETDRETHRERQRQNEHLLVIEDSLFSLLFPLIPAPDSRPFPLSSATLSASSRSLIVYFLLSI